MRRRDLRPARAQRRGQDHHRRDAHHPGASPRRAAPASAASTWWPTRRWPSSSSGWCRSRTPSTASSTAGRTCTSTAASSASAPRESRRSADELLEQFQLAKWAKASVYALSGGMAQRLMVARSILHRPAVLFLDEPTAGLDPQSRLALWEILRRAQRARARPSCSPPTTWRKPTSSATGWRSWTTAGILALDTPAGLKASVGADTIVTVQGERRPAGLAEVLEPRSPRRTTVRGSRRRRRAARARHRAASLPRVVAAAEQRRLRPGRPVGGRTHPRDRLHQPHRQGPARLMTDRPPPPIEPAPAPRRHRRQPPCGRRARPAASPSYALILRDLTVLRKHLIEFVLRTLIQPFLLVLRVPLRVPQDRPGRWAAATGRADRRSPPCWSPAWSASPSCSRASRPWPCSWPRSSASPGRSRTGSRRPCPVWLVAVAKVLSGAVQGLIAAVIVFPIAAVVHAKGVERPFRRALAGHPDPAPAGCVTITSLGLLLGTVFEPRNIGLMFGFVVLPITFLGGTYYQWTRLRAGQGRRLPLAADHRADQPADLRQRGPAGRASPTSATCTSTSSTRCWSGSAPCS